MGMPGHRTRTDRGYSRPTRAVYAICLVALVGIGVLAARRGPPPAASSTLSSALSPTLSSGLSSTLSSAPPEVPPFFDYRHERPGASHKITVADLPPPREAESTDNGPTMVPRPADAWPSAPAGFKVDLYTDGLTNPRLIRTAPNGDLFVVESRPGEIRVLRGLGPGGRAGQRERFAIGLNKPFGLAFYPPGNDPRWLYVGNTDAVVRFPYRSGDLQARGNPETVVELPGGGLLRGGGHWTRDLAFSRDGKTLYVSVGSRSNVDDPDQHHAEYPPRRHPGLRSDRRARRGAERRAAARLRLGHPQRRRDRRSPDQRRALGLGQRARPAGRQPGPRLHHPRRGGRLLRLALVLHRRPPGPAPPRQAPGARGAR